MGVTSEAWTPAPEWRVAFEKQITRETMTAVTNYARKRVRLIERVGRKVDPMYARELMLDAVTDTLDGVVAWDPARASLRAHLLSVVHSRTGHEVVRAVKLPHRSLDDSADDNSSEGRPLEAEASRAVAAAMGSPWRDPSTDERGTRVLNELLRMAEPDDEGLLTLLAAFEQGATEKHEVVEMTGMTPAAYDNARRRMVRLLAKLPPELQDRPRI